MIMEYRVILVESEEGFAVSCPALRGCHSQGSTLDEALENIKSAIREWLDAEPEERSKLTITERTVTV
jgi:predicted RNase H-like HicB family nuclease